MNLKINKKECEFEAGISIFENIDGLNNDYNYLAAIVNGKIEDLNYIIDKKDNIELISRYSNIGKKIYSSSLSLILIMAVKKLMPDKKVNIEYSIGDGLYISIDNYSISHREVKEIEIEMRKIIEDNIKLNKETISSNIAISLFKSEGYDEKIDLIESLNLESVDVYVVDGKVFSFDKVLVPYSSFLDKFKIIAYHPGIVISFPVKEGEPSPEFKEQVNISKVYTNSKKWTELMGIEYAGDLNKTILNNKMDNLILVNETYYNNQLAQCAKQIVDEDMQIVMIAGPSSSGKSTTAKKLAIQLAVYGKNSYVLSTDDYFIDRDKTPLNEYGEKDFESLNAIDLKRLNEDLLDLLEGVEVELPSYNFLTGKSEKSDKKIKLDNNNILIIEGIHSLNPRISKSIPEKNKFKIYVSALTQINIDSHNRISSSDSRLIRRIVRDNNFRGYNAEETLKVWDNVRRGERKYIFPYQENADFYMDTSLVYEFNALKSEAVKNLKTVDKNSEYFYKANDLISLLNNFIELEDLSVITRDSILREFIGE